MKRVLLFKVGGDSSWIGGLYYIKNIIFITLNSKKICNKYDIHIYVDDRVGNMFEEFNDRAKIITYKNRTLLDKVINCKRFLNKNIEYIYYMGNTKYDLILGKKSIYWIADFQHCYYPQYFSRDEVNSRNKYYHKISKGRGKLVLSSQSSKNDFNRFYPDSTVETYIMPFVSYIEKEIYELTEDEEQVILRKFNLQDKMYFCISNQFWCHKNHDVVLKAIKHIVSTTDKYPVKFVFTGKINDYRNQRYCKEIKEKFQDKLISDWVMLLGFISRKEQIAIMKNSKCIIQPSLFEGWGTVLEDAKVLDKEVILSDIPIHREQKNDKCHLFSPHDKNELAILIMKLINSETKSEIKVGINNMYKQAEQYVKGFENLLEC